jgi:hypothetical protein
LIVIQETVMAKYMNIFTRKDVSKPPLCARNVIIIKEDKYKLLCILALKYLVLVTKFHWDKWSALVPYGDMSVNSSSMMFLGTMTWF